MEVTFLSASGYTDPSKNNGDCILVDNGSELVIYDCGCEEHARRVVEYMDEHQADSRTLHCHYQLYGAPLKKFTAKKEVYVPDIYQDYCLLRDGSPYGFEFDISDAELDLYNASGGIKERIQSAYDRL